MANIDHHAECFFAKIHGRASHVCLVKIRFVLCTVISADKNVDMLLLQKKYYAIISCLLGAKFYE